MSSFFFCRRCGWAQLGGTADVSLQHVARSGLLFDRLSPQGAHILKMDGWCSNVARHFSKCWSLVGTVGTDHDIRGQTSMPTSYSHIDRPDLEYQDKTASPFPIVSLRNEKPSVAQQGIHPKSTHNSPSYLGYGTCVLRTRRQKRPIFSLTTADVDPI